MSEVDEVFEESPSLSEIQAASSFIEVNKDADDFRKKLSNISLGILAIVGGLFLLLLIIKIVCAIVIIDNSLEQFWKIKDSTFRSQVLILMGTLSIGGTLAIIWVLSWVGNLIRFVVDLTVPIHYRDKESSTVVPPKEGKLSASVGDFAKIQIEK